jgi:hypothetical protein
MKTFNEVIEDTKIVESSLNEFIVLDSSDFEYLNESEKFQVQEILREYGDKKLAELDEGILGKIFGGVAGFLLGPAIGKIIANALGIEKGIVYDMLTSRLATTALGAALGKYTNSSK